MSTTLDAPVSVADLVAAVRRQQAPRHSPVVVEPIIHPLRSVSIVAAHAGAGATSVALAVTDALAAAGSGVTLVDAAHTPDAFGAVEVEVEAADPDERAGRRGPATVVRALSAATWTGTQDSVTVVDGAVGTSPRRVVVCRASLPSVGRAETLLDDDALLAVVGASRWPRVVHASLGAAARGAQEAGRVVFFPRDRELEIHGVGADPTPAAMQAAALRLAHLLWPDAVELKSRRWKGRR